MQVQEGKSGSENLDTGIQLHSLARKEKFSLEELQIYNRMGKYHVYQGRIRALETLLMAGKEKQLECKINRLRANIVFRARFQLVTIKV